MGKEASFPWRFAFGIGILDFVEIPRKILMVDDEPDVRMLLKARLASNGFQVLEAADGSSGIRIAETEHPDLILLDIRMPGIDGIEVYAALRQRPATQGIPIVFLTALSEGMSPGLMQLDPRRSYWMVGKPYEPAELLTVIRKAMDGGG
jgi:CheY-like chemotaxis protein